MLCGGNTPWSGERGIGSMCVINKPLAENVIEMRSKPANTESILIPLSETFPSL